GGMDLTIDEVTTISTIVQEAAGDDAEIIFGAVHDQTLEGELWVTVIATGLEDSAADEIAPPVAAPAAEPVQDRRTQEVRPEPRPVEYARPEASAPSATPQAEPAPRPAAPATQARPVLPQQESAAIQPTPMPFPPRRPASTPGAPAIPTRTRPMPDIAMPSFVRRSGE